jgi:hypothetical protein
MNVSTLEAPGRAHQRTSPTGAAEDDTARQAGASEPGAGRLGAPLRPAPAVRPARRSGRGTRPSARPPRPLDIPLVKVAPGARARSCAVAVPTPAPTRAASSWRLTDRAIALVVVTGLVVVTAALAVVGLTALRVTGDRYHVPASSSVVSAPRAP